MGEQYSLKVVLEAQDKLSRPLADAQKKIGRFQNFINTVGSVIKTGIGTAIGLGIYEGVNKIKDGIGESISSFAELEQKLKTAKVFAGDWNITLKEMKDRLFDIANKVPISVGSLADAMIELGKAGITGEKAFKILETSALGATAAGEPLEGVMNTLITTLTAFQKDTSDASRVLDILVNAANQAQMSVSDFQTALAYVGPFAKQAGTKLEDVVTAITMLNKAGYDASQAGTYLRGIFADLIHPTKEAEKTLEKYGIQLKDAEGNLKSFPEILEEFREKLEGLSDTEKAEVLNKIFDVRAASAMATLLQSTNEQWESLKNNITETGTAQEQAREMMDTMQGSMIRMQNAIQELKTSFGEALAPAITEFAETVTEFLKEHGDEIKTFFNTIGGIVKTLVGGLKQTIGFFQDIGKNLTIDKIFGESSEDVKTHLKNIFNGINDIVQDFTGKFANYFAKLAEDERIGRIVKHLQGLAKDILAVLDPLINNVVKPLMNAFADYIILRIDLAITALDKFLDFLEKFKDEVDKAIKAILGVFNGAKKSIEGFFNWIKGVWSNVTNSIVNNARDMYEEMVGHSIIPDMVRESLQWLKKLEEGANMTLTPIIEPVTKTGVFTHGFSGESRVIQVYITNETVIIRDERDIDKLAEEISRKLQEEVYRSGGV